MKLKDLSGARRKNWRENTQGPSKEKSLCDLIETIKSEFGEDEIVAACFASDVAATLLTIRVKYGLSQQVATDYLGVDIKTYQKIEECE